MLDIKFTAKFKKDFKKAERQGKDMSKLHGILDLIAHQKPLPKRIHDHPLSGDYGGHRECHIEPDWLLIYKLDNDALILTAVRTGSHSDLLNC